MLVGFALILLAAREGRAQTDEHCLMCLHPPCSEQTCDYNTTTLYIGGLFATFDGDGNNRADDLDGGLEEEAVFHATIAMLNDKTDGW